MTTALTLLAFVCILSYTLAVCLKFKGIPNSISATFYKLEHPYLFCATMWITAGFLMPAILDISKPGTEWMAFLGCAGMLMVGAAPNFIDDLEGNVHTAGAVLCLAGSQLWVAFNCPWVLLLWIGYIIYTIIMMSVSVSYNFISNFLRTKPMFWVEVTALVSTYLTILIL